MSDAEGGISVYTALQLLAVYRLKVETIINDDRVPEDIRADLRQLQNDTGEIYNPAEAKAWLMDDPYADS